MRCVGVCVDHPHFAEKNGHDLVTEVLTILFPPPKQHWRRELSKCMGGLTC
jgi:hypothetical protein